VIQLQRSHDEQRTEQFLGNLLRGGVILSATVVLLGGIIFLWRHGGERASYRHFVGLPPEYREPTRIVAAASYLSGRAIIQLGLLILIATPVARVFCSALAFTWQRDYTYVCLTLMVLAVLLYSLFLDPS
jgi:uncharacterized membrane protein